MKKLKKKTLKEVLLQRDYFFAIYDTLCNECNYYDELEANDKTELFMKKMQLLLEFSFEYLSKKCSQDAYPLDLINILDFTNGWKKHIREQVPEKETENDDLSYYS